MSWNLLAVAQSHARLLLLLIAIALLVAIPPSAQAADITVNATCTIVNAIRSANSDTSRGGCTAGSGADTIALSANITLNGLLPAISSDVTIDGRDKTIDGRDSYRILDINSGAVVIKDLVMTKGNAGGANGGIIRARNTDLTLTRVTLSNGQSSNNGGGLFFDGSSKRLTITDSVISDNKTKDNSGGLGGGIYVRAQFATITKSTISNNIGYSHGGGIYNDSSLTIENSTIYANKSSNGHGGGIYANASATTIIKHVTMNGNIVSSSSGEGDSIYRGGRTNMYNSILAGSDASSHCAGSGPFNQAGNLVHDISCSWSMSGAPGLGAVTGSPAYFPLLSDSEAIDAASSDYCTASDQLGNARPATGCDIGAIESNGPSIIWVSDRCSLKNAIKSATDNEAYSGCLAGRSNRLSTIIFTSDHSHTGSPLEINSPMVIDGNNHSLTGDAANRILDVTDTTLTIKNLTITRGGAGETHGGALRARNTDLTLENVTISDSVSGNNGGGLYFDGGSKTLTITNSAFHNNRTDNSSKGGKGGALFVNAKTATITGSAFTSNRGVTTGGAIYNDGSLTIENSTISGNTAMQEGGGLYTNSGATTTLKHVTIHNNSVTTNGKDGVGIYRGGRTYLYNSIVAGNSLSNQSLCAGSGALTQAGNLIQDNSCSPALSGNPGLGSLTGSPEYHPLSGSSIAIDTASATHCLNVDQVGTSRPQNSYCDIGAFEVLTANVTPTATAPANMHVNQTCSLSDAIKAANTNTVQGGCPAGGRGRDTITLTADVTLSEPLESVTTAIRIEGAGYSISGDDEQRIFSVGSSGDLILNNIGLTKGRGLTPGGGALLNEGALTITRAYIANSNTSGTGGAIHNEGMLVISNSTIANNESGQHAGAIYSASGSTTISHVTFYDNSSGSAQYTRGIHVAGGAVKLHNSLIGNSSSDGGSLCSGTLNENLGNHIQDNTCSPAQSGDPSLGDLVEPASRSAYYPLNTGSPALGNGDDFICSQHQHDQIGAARPASNCHIGAVEEIAIAAQEAAQAASPSNATIASSTPSPVAAPYSSCQVTMTDFLNFRETPEGRILDTLSAGTTLPALGRAPNWYQLDNNGLAGWVNDVYVSTVGDCGCKATASVALRLRAEPNGAVIAAVHQGSVMIALEQVDGWYKVDHNDRIGWISAEYVAKEGSCS